MSSIAAYPAGISDSDDDEFDEYDGFFFEKTKVNKNFQKIEKSEAEIFEESLMQHLRNNDVTSLREVLDNGTNSGFDIDSPFNGHWNLLFYACSYSLPDIVQFLTNERGVCLDSRFNGESALMIACSSTENSDNVLKVVKILCQIEPTLVNRTNYVGENALMLATRAAHSCVIEYLIKVGESYDNINNSGRNLLFYAIEANNVDIARMLLDMKIDADIEDCYGMTAKKFAIECNASEILELFPPDEQHKYQTPSAYYSYSSIENIVPEMFDENNVPSYFPDVVSMLRGMDCERFIVLFSEANISLENFLTTNDDKLEKIGIPLPYQRRRILSGLHNFFKGNWTNKSLYIPENIKSHLTPIDFIFVFSNLLRQTIVLKSQLIYLQKLQKDYGLDIPMDRFSTNHLITFQNHIKDLKRIIETMETTKRPLLIGKQSQSIKSNVIKRLSSYDMAVRALKIVLPLAIVTTITIKLLHSK